MILRVHLDDLQLEFQILDTPVADLWIERMSQRDQWPLDDPKRFYGFNSREQEEHNALVKINACIEQVKSRYPDLDRGPVTDCKDQDTLNYWHHVFETRHGFLEQEDRSDPLTEVLCELNVAVHRCESVARRNHPRFVCTWYGMPKTQTLDADIMSKHGTLHTAFGSVCLNYCEIGKTLEDLSRDRDNYITDAAFRPFQHYSADFSVRLYEESLATVSDRISQMRQYYHEHQDFFFKRGFDTFDDARLLPLRFPVAQLIETQPRSELIQAIAQRQHITKVELQ